MKLRSINFPLSYLGKLNFHYHKHLIWFLEEALLFWFFLSPPKVNILFRHLVAKDSIIHLDEKSWIMI